MNRSVVVLARSAALIASVVVALVSGPAAAADVVPSAIQTALELGQCRTAGDAINAGLERNEAEAWFYAGYLYDVTNCVEEDAARAARYYLQAAKLGDLRGADAIGLAHGLGRGVKQDYAVAYDWFVVRQRRGAPAVAVDPDFARTSGYAMTVARLARDKARYPDDARRADTRASLEAVFDVSTGLVTARFARVDIPTGSNVARMHVFVDAVTAAYAEAVALAPKPVAAPTNSTVFFFTTPWRFGIVRDDDDRPIFASGAVSIGDTDPLTRR